MSTKIYEEVGLIVTSFCGPADTIEATRARLQIDILGRKQCSIGYGSAAALHEALGRWLDENKPADNDERSLITDEHHDELGDPLRRMLADLDYGQRNTLEKLLRLIHKEAYDEGRSDEAKP